MNQDDGLRTAARWMFVVTLFGVACLACAGANGDPAPEPVEAGAALDPCADAGAAE